MRYRAVGGGVLALLAAIAAATVAPAWAQAPGASRAVPTFPRPPGFPDPAWRVEYLGGESAPPMRVRTGPGQLEPLYRRQADGSYAPARAAGYRIANAACPSLPAGPDPVTRMIDLAAAEWAHFGLPVLDLSLDHASLVPRRTAPPDPYEIVPPRRNASLGHRVLRHAPRLGLMEDDAAVRATIAGYWAATGSEEALRVQSLVEYGWRETGWAMPWSAAFVSWLACEAGLTPAQFRRSGAHYDYVRAAVRARDGEDGEHAYLAYALAEAVPAPGDLLCTARADGRLASLDDVRRGDAGSTALHCDLVVKTAPAQRRLYAIGGNVNHAVTLSMIATDGAGRPLTDADATGAHRWFAVLKPRRGRPRHDLDGTPTVATLYRDYARYATGLRAPAPLPLPPAGREPGSAPAGEPEPAAPARA
ncbi:DUF2272 domain-containing protein, partial [Vulcaniibacterium tengchongense]